MSTTSAGNGDEDQDVEDEAEADAVEPAVEDQVRVLVVEDEESYRLALESALRLEGYHVEVALDGADGLARFTENLPDIVLLDLLLPDTYGTDLLRRMHAIAPVPVLIISAVNAELDVVLGLELGAADYVTKPFRLRELVARMHTILRRVSPPATEADKPLTHRRAPVDRGIAAQARAAMAADRPDIRFGRVEVSFARRQVTVDGVQVHLSRREYDLLAALLSPLGTVRTRDELIDLLWPNSELTDSRTLDTHIYRLRSKLEIDPSSPRIIMTVRGVGFRIDVDDVVPLASSGSTANGSPAVNGGNGSTPDQPDS
ncbi:MAG TPA: response regulator transcription factor [Acidimicrobiales bacterium]|jgi:two-component system response regulator RegX3|nr:response regulator transcription factor [Acidimicrobiales bacterium]